MWVNYLATWIGPASVCLLPHFCITFPHLSHMPTLTWVCTHTHSPCTSAFWVCPELTGIFTWIHHTPWYFCFWYNFAYRWLFARAYCFLLILSLLLKKASCISFPFSASLLKMLFIEPSGSVCSLTAIVHLLLLIFSTKLQIPQQLRLLIFWTFSLRASKMLPTLAHIGTSDKIETSKDASEKRPLFGWIKIGCVGLV